MEEPGASPGVALSGWALPVQTRWLRHPDHVCPQQAMLFK